MQTGIDRDPVSSRDPERPTEEIVLDDVVESRFGESRGRQIPRYFSGSEYQDSQGRKVAILFTFDLQFVEVSKRTVVLRQTLSFYGPTLRRNMTRDPPEKELERLHPCLGEPTLPSPSTNFRARHPPRRPLFSTGVYGHRPTETHSMYRGDTESREWKFCPCD